MSDRIELNPLASSDFDLILEMFSDPEVVKYAGNVLTAEEIRTKMSSWTKRGGDGYIGIWCISDRETGESFGTVALLPMPVDEDDTDFSLVIPGKMPGGDVEIGYFLKRSAWGLGYATEACKRLLKFVFWKTPLEEVVATFEEENTSSRNVLEKVGFIDHGTMRSYGETGPNFRITRDEWLRNS